MARKYLTPIDLTKNELQNARLQNLAAAPASPVSGQFYFDTTLQSECMWDGTSWRIKDPLRIPDGSLSLAKLATNPLARANHTGTQVAATISDLATTVQGYRLDQFAQPSANINLNGQKFTNAGAPAPGSSDFVRQIDLENAINSSAASIDSKESVRVVAISNVATLSGLQTIDGVTLVANDRILLTGQTTASQNGVYIAGSGAWIRATDADDNGEITPGAFWFVEEGTTYGGSQWRCNNTGTINIGSTDISIFQFGITNNYTAGNGLTLVGNEFSAVQGLGIIVTASNIQIDTSIVARKVSATIGDGVATQFTITHSLGSQDVISQIREIATNDVVDADIRNSGINTILVSFAVAPAANSYRVVIQG